MRTLRSARHGHATLTEAAQREIRKAIGDGVFPPGSQLPTEAQLVSLLSVSRPIVREALRSLEQDGLITRQHGVGTFVRKGVIPKNLNVNFGITEMIRAAGQNPGTSYLQVQRAEAEGEVATRLELPVGTPVIVVERVRTANGRPVVYSTDTFSQSLVGDADLDKGQLLNRSLYEILETDYGLVIEYGIAQVLPCKATRYIAKRLSIPVGSSLLFLRQTDYSPADRPVLHSLEYHLPDAFDFIIVRRGPAKL